jgi:hypothetical protein
MLESLDKIKNIVEIIDHHLENLRGPQGMVKLECHKGSSDLTEAVKQTPYEEYLQACSEK